MISIARRNLTRREFSVIIVRSRDILLMTIEANKSKIKKMGPDLLMVTIFSDKGYDQQASQVAHCEEGLWVFLLFI